jgi:hypothetical protein
MKDFNYTLNEKFLKFNYTLYNDEIHSYALDFTLNLLAAVTKLLVYVKIRIPEDEHDKNFSKEIIRTVVDVERTLNGTNRNLFVAKVAEGLSKGALKMLKFPLKKV